MPSKSGLLEAGVISDIWIGYTQDVLDMLANLNADVNVETSQYVIGGQAIEPFMKLKEETSENHGVIQIGPDTTFRVNNQVFSLVQALRKNHVQELPFDFTPPDKEGKTT